MSAPNTCAMFICLRVSGFGFRVSGVGFRVSGFGFRIPGFGFRVSGFGFRVSGLKPWRRKTCLCTCPRAPRSGGKGGCINHPGGNPGANLKSISHRCHLREVAFVWELTKETIYLPLGCLQVGLSDTAATSQEERWDETSRLTIKS